MKKRLVVFIDKYLSYSLISLGGVLDNLIANFDVTLLTVPQAENGVRAAVAGRCPVETVTIGKGGMLSSLNSRVASIFSMTYAKADDGRRNRTGALHRQAHRKLARNSGLAGRLRIGGITGIARLAEDSRILRRTLNRIYALTAPVQKLNEKLHAIRPDLVITMTAGLGLDGVFLAAAKQCQIKSLALIQSWDRTASKGYPPCHPDACIVWTDAMAREARDFLEIPQNRIFVEGAPVWDHYFQGSNDIDETDKIRFLREWDLDPAKKLVFVAINGPATHQENLKLVADLCAACHRGALPGLQFLFRSHPAYIAKPVENAEITKVFEQNENSQVRLMCPMVEDPSIKDHVISADDYKFMHDAFRVCDITVSIMSTWMIESAIFDKPNICIEYGRYQTSLYDFDLSDYKAEHIERIFDYGAVHRVRSFAQLLNKIPEVVANPHGLQHERQNLRDGETGPNKGCAGKAVLNRIQILAGS